MSSSSFLIVLKILIRYTFLQCSLSSPLFYLFPLFLSSILFLLISLGISFSFQRLSSNIQYFWTPISKNEILKTPSIFDKYLLKAYLLCARHCSRCLKFINKELIGNSVYLAKEKRTLALLNVSMTVFWDQAVSSEKDLSVSFLGEERLSLFCLFQQRGRRLGSASFHEINKFSPNPSSCL